MQTNDQILNDFHKLDTRKQVFFLFALRAIAAGENPDQVLEACRHVSEARAGR